MNKTKYQIPFAENIFKSKKALIALLIVAIVVGHFVFQMSFITNENERFIESMANSEASAPQKSEAKNEIAENKSADLQATESDIVIVAPPNRNAQTDVQTIKVVEKQSIRQAEIVPVKNSSKAEIKRESKAERLRRAEKILTGF